MVYGCPDCDGRGGVRLNGMIYRARCEHGLQFCPEWVPQTPHGELPNKENWEELIKQDPKKFAKGLAITGKRMRTEKPILYDWLHGKLEELLGSQVLREIMGTAAESPLGQSMQKGMS